MATLRSVTTPQVIALIVAVISALASVAGALSARRSADAIDRRRHEVDAVDHDRVTFNEAFSAFMSAGGAVTDKERLLPFLFASEALQVHPRTDDEMRRAIGTMCNTVQAGLVRGSTVRASEINEAIATCAHMPWPSISD